MKKLNDWKYFFLYMLKWKFLFSMTGEGLYIVTIYANYVLTVFVYEKKIDFLSLIKTDKKLFFFFKICQK